jgi:ABC-type nitrate/sulfonate/bicarbonate transport system ATPase subunit
MAERVVLTGVGKAFGGGPGVLQGIDLTLVPGEFVALLGASGCGKSTLLRLVAGLEKPTAGEVRLGDRPVRDVDPRCAVVFQEPRLLPWRSVAANVALGARHAGGSASPERLLDRVGLAGFEGAWPHQLSGGMAQRAALARALAGRPDVLLLDEPFAALDALTRLRMGDLLADVRAETEPTTLMVTHDVDEALRLADRVVLLAGQPAGVRAVYAPPPRHDEATVARLRVEILGHFGLGAKTRARQAEAAIA